VEIVPICPLDRIVIFQVKWIQDEKIIEVIFEENVTQIKRQFPMKAYATESRVLRIDSFWKIDEDMSDYQRETILFVRESEFYKNVVRARIVI